MWPYPVQIHTRSYQYRLPDKSEGGHGRADPAHFMGIGSLGKAGGAESKRARKSPWTKTPWTISPGSLPSWRKTFLLTSLFIERDYRKLALWLTPPPHSVYNDVGSVKTHFSAHLPGSVFL